MEGVAQHEGGVRSTAAGSASRGPTRETDTIGAMLEEEIAIQETKEQSRLAEEARLRQQVEEHERLESEEEMQQLKDDEDRWERHRAAQLQEQEDKLMAEALAGKSLKRKFTVVTSVLGRDGKILGTSSQEVQAAAGENVRVQFEIQENEAIQSDPEQDSAEHEVEVDACDEEVLQQAQEEWPELSWHPHERLRKAWFHLWKVGVLSGAQIERRWGLEVLWEFEAELAEELVRQRATQASQDILASQMAQDGGGVGGGHRAGMRNGSYGVEVTAADTQMDGMEMDGMEMNDENQAAGVEGETGLEGAGGGEADGAAGDSGGSVAADEAARVRHRGHVSLEDL